MIQTPTAVEDSNDKGTDVTQEQIALFQNSAYRQSIAAKIKTHRTPCLPTTSLTCSHQMSASVSEIESLASSATAHCFTTETFPEMNMYHQFCVSSFSSSFSWCVPSACSLATSKELFKGFLSPDAWLCWSSLACTRQCAKLTSLFIFSHTMRICK